MTEWIETRDGREMLALRPGANARVRHVTWKDAVIGQATLCGDRWVLAMRGQFLGSFPTQGAALSKAASVMRLEVMA